MGKRMQEFGAQLGAIWREAVNDVRGTWHQVMLGQPEHPQGMGVPLNPTPQLVTAELTGNPYTAERQPSNLYGQAMEQCKQQAAHAPTQEKGQELER